MLLLALDSSATASVTLGRQEADGQLTILAQRTSADTRSHAEVMTPYVQEVLEEAGVSAKELDALICGTGPGPFTGLRAGIMTARTLALAWKKPLYGLMSLTALAQQVAPVARSAGQEEFLVASDARRREIYWASYRLTDRGYQLLQGPTVGPASQAPQLAAYGMGASLYPGDLQAQAGYDQLQPAADQLLAAALKAGLENLSTDTSPLYLRESDAKVPETRKKVGP